MVVMTATGRLNMTLRHAVGAAWRDRTLPRLWSSILSPPRCVIWSSA